MFEQKQSWSEQQTTHTEEAMSRTAGGIFDALLLHRGEEITPELAGRLACKLAEIDLHEDFDTVDPITGAESSIIEPQPTIGAALDNTIKAYSAVMERLHALDQTVIAARKAGATWHAIGDSIGTSQQAAHSRWAKKVKASENS